MGPKGAASEQERWVWRALGQGGSVGMVGSQRGGQLQWAPQAAQSRPGGPLGLSVCARLYALWKSMGAFF